MDKIVSESCCEILNQENEGETTIKKYNYEKEPKQKFCARCGAAIDMVTRRCTGCGKQYFRGVKFTKFSVTVMVLSVMLVISSILNIVQLVDRNEIDEQRAYWLFEADELQSEVEQLRNWVAGYELYVGIIVENSKVYHKASCEQISSGTFDINIGWIQGLEPLGYIACPYCHK